MVKRKGGMSLVELLVCVSIVVTISALLFPVLNSAKAKAKESVCMSNLRQMGLAIEMYRGEYGDSPVGTQSAMGLPPTHFPLNLDAKLLQCTGRSYVPGSSEALYWLLFSYETAEQQETWSEYSARMGPRAVLIADGNHFNDGKPFSELFTQNATGLQVDLAVLKRKKRGHYGTLEFWSD